MRLMYITNDENVAKIAEESGVDWIFIDLEIVGKEERQGHLDTVISRHSINDVKKIKSVLNKSDLLVRVNPIYDKSEKEINRVINDGANIVMLPFFKTCNEVEKFIKYVDGRAKTCLLLETPEAVENIDSILNVEGIDYIHIGLNDLHLGYGMKFMFELLIDGTVEKLVNKIKKKDIPYGFGGIARLGYGTLPAENIIAEHYRLESTMTILSRSFCNTKSYEDLNEIQKIFSEGVKEIRDFESFLKNKDNEYYNINRKKTNEIINKVVNMIEKENA